MALLYMDGFDVQDTAMRWIVMGPTTDVTFGAATRFGTGKAVTLLASNTTENLTILRAITASSSIYAGARR